MKESIGDSFVLQLVILFVFLFIVFFATSLSYTKAFKVKNRIVSILEKYEVSAVINGKLSTPAKNEINSNLKELGYKVSSKSGCTSRLNGTVVYNSDVTGYRYCVQMYDSGERGIYYGVTAYMYFDVPIINKTLEFPVYGETKVMGLLD